MSTNPRSILRGTAVLTASLTLVSATGAQVVIPTVDAREEIRIASTDSVRGMLLTNMDLTVLPDGRIVTAHPRESIVRVFDPSGRLIKIFGGRGDGPSELRDPRSIGSVADRIWVRDGGRRGYGVFDARTYEPIGDVATGPTSGGYHGLISDTTSFHTTPGQGALRGPGMGDSARVSVYDRRGQRRMTIDVTLRLAGHYFTEQIDEISPGGFLTGRTVARTTYSPLFTRTHIELVPGGREAYALEASELWKGPPGQFTIRRIETATGRVSAPITVSLPVRRVTASEADSLIRQAMRSIRPIRGRESQHARRIEAYRAKVRVPAIYPAFMSFVPSADGVLWLREWARPQTWLVVDVTGKPLMRVRLPTNLRVMAVSRTHAWGVTLDADDLPIISRYRVQR